jgi:hypothetical protein
MRVLLIVAAVLVFLAGMQLFVFTERTDRYFAWTVNPPLTAAFLGAAYWSSVGFELMAQRERVWANARIAVPAVFVFTALTLFVTLHHFDRFHHGDAFEVRTQIVTWIWVAIYVVVPVLMLWLAVVQLRRPGGDPPRVAPLPLSLRLLVGAQAVALLGVGASLLASPGDVAETLWPWTLTPLTGRAIGAWLLSLGVAAAHALWENDARRLRPAAVAYLLFGVLEFIAIARYPDTMSWSDSQTIVYVVFLATTFVTGTATLWLDNRANVTQT